MVTNIMTPFISAIRTLVETDLNDLAAVFNTSVGVALKSRASPFKIKRGRLGGHVRTITM